jgi:hypothetical protein
MLIQIDGSARKKTGFGKSGSEAACAAIAALGRGGAAPTGAAMSGAGRTATARADPVESCPQPNPGLRRGRLYSTRKRRPNGLRRNRIRLLVEIGHFVEVHVFVDIGANQTEHAHVGQVFRFGRNAAQL